MQIYEYLYKYVCIASLKRYQNTIRKYKYKAMIIANGCGLFQHHFTSRSLGVGCLCVFHLASLSLLHARTYTDSSDNSLKYRIIIRNITRRHSILSIRKSQYAFFNIIQPHKYPDSIVYGVLSIHACMLWILCACSKDGLPCSEAMRVFCIDLTSQSGECIFYTRAIRSTHSPEREKHVLFDFKLYITMIPNFI